ncbi:MAG: hypothetical protein EXX96DRAFT_559586 [Benjaminiella poitrasii]|nr:MAG: hypothetical protein EXX96DRAFT_559586 [Benjaminiella poitrasii]
MTHLSDSAIQFWDDICIKAFNNDPSANDFVLFFEGCKTVQQNDNSIYVWKTAHKDYQHNLEQLGCTLQTTNDIEPLFALPSDALSELLSQKGKTRADWHRNRQRALKEHLDYLLQQPMPPLTLNNEHRVVLVKEFAQTYGSDLVSVPFLRGLAGLLKYQLKHRQCVAEWAMSEYILTQNNEDAMDAYVRLLRGVLGMQSVYQDDQDDTVAIAMDEPSQPSEPVLTWRMSPDMDNRLIQDIVRCLPNISDVQQHGYKTTDIPRKQSLSSEHKSLFQWIYDILSHCLSFLHK